MSMPWRSGNKIRLLENGDQFFPRVFGALQRAQHVILIETFILFDDDVGRALQREILAAARRGVSISIMVDGYGTPYMPESFVDALTTAGVRFLYYDPRPRFMGMRTNLFRQLHCKIVVCDHTIAFVGGINFSAEHLTSYGPDAKRDYAVEVKGPIVIDIARYTHATINHHNISLRRWRRGNHYLKRYAGQGAARVRLVWRDNHQHRDDIEHGYIDMLRRAKRQVIIANTYFFPGYRLLKEIRDTAQRGVQVQLLVQGKPDIPLAKEGEELLYNYLINAGVEVYEYQRGPLHAKIALQDEFRTTVGSCNLDPLSLSFNLEANLFIHDQAFNWEMRNNLYRLLHHDCQRVHESQLPVQRGWLLIKSVLDFHFLRHFPAIAGWLPAHTPKLTEVVPPVQPEMETQDHVRPDNKKVKS